MCFVPELVWVYLASCCYANQEFTMYDVMAQVSPGSSLSLFVNVMPLYRLICSLDDFSIVQCYISAISLWIRNNYLSLWTVKIWCTSVYHTRTLHAQCRYLSWQPFQSRISKGCFVLNLLWKLTWGCTKIMNGINQKLLATSQSIMCWPVLLSSQVCCSYLGHQRRLEIVRDLGQTPEGAQGELENRYPLLPQVEQYM